MDKLSNDALFTVESFLDVKSLLSLGTCCTVLHSTSENNELWLQLLHFELPSYQPFKNISKYVAREKLKFWLAGKTWDLRYRWQIFGTAQKMVGRYLHRSVTNPINGCSYVFSGESTTRLLGDIWKVTVDENAGQLTLKELHTSSPSPFPTCACTMACMNDSLYIFGGFTNVAMRQEYSNNFWRSCHLSQQQDDRIEWECLTQAIELPPGRFGHTMVSACDRYLIIFGGSAPGTAHRDLWVYCEAGSAPHWREVAMGTGPCGRGGHSATIVGDEMYIFGGNDLHRSFDDLWAVPVRDIIDAYHYADQHPSPLPPQPLAPSLGQGGVDSPHERADDVIVNFRCVMPQSQQCGGPSPGIGHSAVCVGRCLIVYGGRCVHAPHGGRYNEGVFRYQTDTGVWDCILGSAHDPPSVRPSPRTGHCAIATSTGIVYVGGLLPSRATTSEFLHLNLFGVGPPEPPRSSASPAIAAQARRWTATGGGDGGDRVRGLQVGGLKGCAGEGEGLVEEGIAPSSLSPSPTPSPRPAMSMWNRIFTHVDASIRSLVVPSREQQWDTLRGSEVGLRRGPARMRRSIELVEVEATGAQYQSQSNGQLEAMAGVLGMEEEDEEGDEDFIDF